VTPDLLVAAMTYAASGMMLRFSSGRMKVASAALLGCALGIGFLAKTVMLPFGLVVLATMLAVAWRRRAGARLVGVALLGFLAISTPFIAALSWNYHRFTFGDSAKLNAAWFISGARPLYRHWQGNGTIAATPQHPTRKLLNWPEVYEFATPVAGTYPVWYDPTYWWAGIYARLTPALELGALRRSLWRIEHYPKAYLVFVIVALLMLLVSHRSRDFLSRLVRFWPVLVPAAAVFLMYAALNWEPRYTAGAMVVGCGAVIASTMISGEEKRTKVLRATSMLIAALVVGLVLVNLGRSYGVSGILAQRIELAENLRAVGIEPGARIALIGDGLHAGDWARLDKARIIAEVPHNLGTGDSVAAFWKLSPEKEQSVLNILRSTGAQAVVADVQPKTLPPGWVRVGNTGHSVFFFR
jgi:hypothetical protein